MGVTITSPGARSMGGSALSREKENYKLWHEGMREEAMKKFPGEWVAVYRGMIVERAKSQQGLNEKLNSYSVWKLAEMITDELVPPLGRFGAMSVPGDKLIVRAQSMEELPQKVIEFQRQRPKVPIIILGENTPVQVLDRIKVYKTLHPQTQDKNLFVMLKKLPRFRVEDLNEIAKKVERDPTTHARVHAFRHATGSTYEELNRPFTI